MRNSQSILLISCLAIAFSLGCSAQRAGTDRGTIRGRIDFNRVLSWLPADTETLLVANGPIWMPNFRTAEDYKNHAVTREELEKAFESMTMGLFNSENGLLETSLEGKKLLFALEASRRFRSPAGLGELPFEGCALAIFKDDLGDRREAFMKEAAKVAVRTEEIEGQNVAVFEESREQDIWTLFVTFPQDGVVLVATDKSFLQEMLARMGGAEGERALPDALPEWKYINKQAQFWGLRHYVNQHDTPDPTSPFGGRRTANVPDNEAIGLAYQAEPSERRAATLTYLSGPKVGIRRIEVSRFPSASEPEATSGLHIQLQDLAPGVIQSTYDLNYSQSLDWFLFVLMGNMGHAIYI